MTIGQRVAQKRKEQGLSQEALGEALGVSRQSVYKWESDNALPEIDKFITMSKLFGVTIGWLLGVEEPVPEEDDSAAAGPAAPPPDPGGAELTEAQLNMVEEIVERYLAAQQPRKKRRWPWAAGAAAALALLAALVSLRGDLRNMRGEYGSLQTSIQMIDRNMQFRIDSITSQVEEALKSQNSLTASYGAEIVSGDLAANSVTFAVHATPRTYTGGMSAVFVADNGKAPAEVSAEAGPGQAFSAQITCEMTDGITLSVVFVTGDKRETQTLESFLWLYSNSLPDVAWPESGLGMQKELNDAGELRWTEEDYAYFPNTSQVSSTAVYDFGRAEAKSVRVGLFRNQELLGWLEPCEKPESYRDMSVQGFFRFPEISVKPEAGDEFRLCTAVEDVYGRKFICRGLPYTARQGESRLALAEGGEIGMCGAEGWAY